MVYEDVIKKAFVRTTPADELFVSEVGICLRRSILARRTTVIKAIDNMLLEHGVIMHEVVQTYLEHALNCQAEVEIEDEIEGVKVSGRVDLLCPRNDGFDLLELKTTGYDAWEVKYYHKVQVALYKAMLEKRGVKVNNVYVVYINRQTLNVKEFRLRESDLEEGMDLAVKFIRDYMKYQNVDDIHKITISDKTFCKGCEFYSVCYNAKSIFDFAGQTKS
ncbi:CRISPR/Cas system associated [Sulfolobales Mexican rudivirus 1]|uniref:CRISPR-associated Cas4-like protein n=1 Tax=Sulfolobales Mexican rod-shaped virus 1 TaxID=2848122 RepID=K4NX71_9VIRU|nr:CRISPR/Cas system associated [Sulfolobales Mexican rudivirus 1]AFV51236.1 CRISPR-associated Cas4-like protein [Sulfolobales Mexican rod-shaped virus 1]